VEDDECELWTKRGEAERTLEMRICLRVSASAAKPRIPWWSLSKAIWSWRRAQRKAGSSSTNETFSYCSPAAAIEGEREERDGGQLECRGLDKMGHSSCERVDVPFSGERTRGRASVDLESFSRLVISPVCWK
jgi:hypothetical protein